MKKHFILTSFAGAPISLLALWLSYWAFAIVFTGNLASSWFALPGIGGVWAVFTGIRNLLRFDTAHLCLRWHDWVGGIFGFLTNALLTFLIIMQTESNIRANTDLWITLLLLVSVPPLLCFCVVAWRFFFGKKTLP